jgi:peptidoglycan/xylan/chitin deacetylase (PgdA/CDA1 family)
MYSRREFLRLSGAAILSAALPALQTGLSLPAVVYHGSRNRHYIALTFDDCYHAQVLEQLSAMAAPYPQFHYTFFAVGEALQNCEIADPGIWRRLLDRGHLIEYHTMHHIDTWTLSAAAMLADFDEWLGVLRQVLGFLPDVHFAKSPFNDVSPSFETLCAERGLVDTRFSAGFEATTVADGLTAATKVQNGDIVQMHTYQDPPKGRLDVSITEKVLPYLAAQGYALVTMSELYDDLLRSQIDPAGCQAASSESLTRTCLD